MWTLSLLYFCLFACYSFYLLIFLNRPLSSPHIILRANVSICTIGSQISHELCSKWRSLCWAKASASVSIIPKIFNQSFMIARHSFLFHYHLFFVTSLLSSLFLFWLVASFLLKFRLQSQCLFFFFVGFLEFKCSSVLSFCVFLITWQFFLGALWSLPVSYLVTGTVLHPVS